MKKREFLKTGLIGVVGVCSISTVTGKTIYSQGKKNKFYLPELSFSYDELTPFMDRETLIKLHTERHAEFTNNLNRSLDRSGIPKTTARKILENATIYNNDIVRNAGGYFNHRIFWRILTPNGKGIPQENIGQAIESQFGSFQKFKKHFLKTSHQANSSEWVWLSVKNDGQLMISTTSETENPIQNTQSSNKRSFPVFGMKIIEGIKDVNQKAEYVNAFWNVLNWDVVEKRFQKGLNA